jgi:isoquinoline 1-oxidoreductase alpha subunit
MSLELTLNGQRVVFSSPPDTPLLWALRDEMKLVGTKFGCGAGLCGACTVMVGGEQTRACQASLAEAAGKTVTTIEGISGDAARAVIDAWVGATVPQCGYCQPGFVMAATSIIAAKPEQSRDDVLSQITNICRCGTYDAIRVAVGLALDSLKAGASTPSKTRAER